MTDQTRALTRLKNLSCFFLDLDGTVYLGDRLLEGSLDFLNHLDKLGIDYLFLTNNSSKSADFYVEKLKKMGVKGDGLKVLTSGQATASYAVRHYPGQKAFLLANSLVSREMAAMGLEIDLEKPDYVIITYDTELDYHKLDRVCYFVRQGLPYLASHPDFNCPTEYGFAPDIGATIAYIEASTGRRPDLIIGKPYEGVIDEALKLMGVEADQVAMVGDRLYTDLAAAIKHKLLGILVLSGETNKAMLADSDIRPDLVYDRLVDILKDLK